MSSAPVIGVVGTAKNTGKTTTLSYLMHQAHRLDVPLGITGIGYDGEELDNITSLPKPRLLIPEGTIVATSEHCLRNSSAKFEILTRTGVLTPLGEVVTLRITQPGLMVLAGPNRKSTLQLVLGQMKNFGVEFILVDGSLNRIAPMAIADSIIFTTGAARNTDVRVLAEEMKIIEHAFSFPFTAHDTRNRKSVFLSEGKTTIEFPMVSVLDQDDTEKIVGRLNQKTECFFVPGLLAPRAMERVMTLSRNSRFELILSDPITLLLSAEPQQLAFLITSIERNALRLTFSTKPRLAAVTINPFYPKTTGTAFAPAYVDKEEFMRLMRRALHRPVFNVKENCSGDLFSLFV